MISIMQFNTIWKKFANNDKCNVLVSGGVDGCKRNKYLSK